MINNETVYNKWLAVTRSQRGKPFQLRKDFSGIEKEEFYPHLCKLVSFFQKHPNLFTDDFFIAPFKLYSNEKGYYSLKFYSSQKGLVACSKYFDEIVQMAADNQIQQVKKSYEFIGNFCLKNKILVRDYPFYKIGSYPECLIHLKDHVVSPYVIMSFPALYVQVSALCSDEKLLFFGEHLNLNEIMKKYNNSPLLKKKSLEYFHKITEIVEKKHKTS